MKQLSQAFVDIFQSAPLRVSLCLILMVLQGLFSGVGLLLLIPLLQLTGMELGDGSVNAALEPGLSLLAGIGQPLSLTLVLAIYVAVVGSFAGIQYLLSVTTIEVQQNYVRRKRDNLYRSLLRTRWQFVIQRRMSEFLHCLSTQVQMIGESANSMLRMMSEACLALVYVGISFLLSWELSLVAAAFGCCLLLLITPMNRRALVSGKVQLASYKSIFHMLDEQLHSLKMIKSHAGEALHASRLSQVGKKLEEQAVAIVRINALTQLMYMLGAVISFSVFFYLAVKWLQIDIPTLAVLLLVLSRLLPKFSTIQAAQQRVLHQIPAFLDVKAMERDCEAHWETELADESTTLPFAESICVNKVTHHYPGSARPALENFSATIGKNQTVLVSGPSGSGKSTLADIVVGLLQPESGAVLIDGRELTQQNRQAWRRKLFYLTQEMYLFHDTIRANLSLFAPEAAEEDLWEALDMAAAKEFVLELKEGIDTVIGDQGIRLSGGEKQRICLARAILTQPDLLILDEATSALDPENEERIHDELRRLHGRFTLIIISHRPISSEFVDAEIRLQAPVNAPRENGSDYHT